MEEQQDTNQIPITFSVSIGEINAIFGVIAASAFQVVMQPLSEKISGQIRSQNIPAKSSQAEALAVVVPVTLTLGELNSIFSVLTSSGFVAVMQPVMDKITEQAKLSVNVQQPTNPVPVPAPIDLSQLN